MFFLLKIITRTILKIKIISLNPGVETDVVVVDVVEALDEVEVDVVEIVE